VPSPRTHAPEGAPDRCQVRRPFVIPGRGALCWPAPGDGLPLTGLRGAAGADRL